MNYFFSLLLMLTCSTSLWAGKVVGVVTDEKGETIPMVNILVKGTQNGTTTDQNGKYGITLSKGNYTLVFSFVGYKKVEKQVSIRSTEVQTINIQLEPDAAMLSDFVVAADYKDFAKEIARKARDFRKDQRDRLKKYSVHTYQRSALTGERKVKEKDSLKSETDSTQWIVNDTSFLKSETSHLVETVSDAHIDPPGKFREDIIALKDHSDIKPKDNFRGGGASFTVEFGEPSITPESPWVANPYVLIRDRYVYDFDIYESLINIPSICEKQLLSPIGNGAVLNYSYDYGGETVDKNGKKLYRILVKPLFPGEALFEGEMLIADSSFALMKCDLKINPRVLLFCEEFHLVMEYAMDENGFVMPVKKEFNYKIKDGKTRYYGNVSVLHSDYSINRDYPDQFFTNEITRYATDAYDKDSSYWKQNRSIRLNEKEQVFEHRMDSLRNYYHSDDYYSLADSSFNRINIWSFLVNGIGHRSRKRDIEFYINPLVMQAVPFGIGGYRHRLGGYFNKGFDNGYVLETTGDIDYGFSNKDVKGKLGVGLTYNPIRFMRTFVRVGDYYDMINNYASASTFFSRSNYARNKMFSISQRMEIVNGLYGELTYEFNDQIPITGLKMDSWSQDLFDTLNNPTAFDRYTKSEFRLQLTYRIRQQYTIRKGRKIVFTNKYPELNFIYRKGVPGMLNSEVNFDYIEIGAKHEGKIARLGTFKWNIQAGSFVNRQNLRVLEYKYFRGSDQWIFSDPLKSFQLLGPSLSTATAYFRANIIHHFDGVILSKVPVINWFKINLAAGGGTLLMPEEKFAHAEAFGGIERAIRIRKQIIRLGAYAVTSVNTENQGDFHLKFGISFFNPFSGKYDY